MNHTRFASALAMAALAAILLPSFLQAQITFQRTYGGADYDCGLSVQQTSDNGYIIAGYSFSFGAGGSDVYLVKTDAAGDTPWTRTYGGSDNDYGNSVQQTADDGYIIVGGTNSYGSGGGDVYLIKTDSCGDTVWTKTFGNGGWFLCGGASVKQTADSGYITTGQFEYYHEPGMQVCLIKTGRDGNTHWMKTFGGENWDEGRSVQQTADGGYVVAGITSSFGGGGADVYLVKTDSLGNVAVSVAETNVRPIPTAALSLTCEPNPFRTRTAIGLRLTADSPAELAIFDVGGRRVRTLIVNRTSYTVWNGTDDLGHALPSGAYFIRVDAGNEHVTTRLVLQR
jgi:hypothetical protein